MKTKLNFIPIFILVITCLLGIMHAQKQPLTIAQELFMFNRDNVTREIKSDAQNRVIWDENFQTTYNYKDDSFYVPSNNGDNKGWDFITHQEPIQYPQPGWDKGVIAFSLYKILVIGTSDYIYMDYRDRDYWLPNGALEGDVYLWYHGNGIWECQGHL